MTDPTNVLLLLATTNPGKLREMVDILLDCAHTAPLPDRRLTIVSPGELGKRLQVAETGQTYAENAALKAQAFCEATGLITLADDSGLEVEALGGAPGIYSARYAPQPGATDADRRALLLERLADFPRPWTARFRCAVCVAAPGLPPLQVEGDCPGEIIPTERGQNGFGYDPIFWLPELGCTMAELPDTQKNQISHRARAIRAAWGLF